MTAKAMAAMVSVILNMTFSSFTTPAKLPAADEEETYLPGVSPLCRGARYWYRGCRRTSGSGCGNAKGAPRKAPLWFGTALQSSALRLLPDTGEEEVGGRIDRGERGKGDGGDRQGDLEHGLLLVYGAGGIAGCRRGGRLRTWCIAVMSGR
jgi:hypothetical protein